MRLSVPCAILAVGSSVFSDEYDKEMTRRMIHEAVRPYGDIDLLVVPEKVLVTLNDLENSVQDALDSLGFKWEGHKVTTCGVSYHTKYNGTHIPFLNIDYGRHSISTALKNGRKIDLILGRDDLLEEIATHKIAEERRENLPFSLLYRR